MAITFTATSSSRVLTARCMDTLFKGTDPGSSTTKWISSGWSAAAAILALLNRYGSRDPHRALEGHPEGNADRDYDRRSARRSERGTGTGIDRLEQVMAAAVKARVKWYLIEDEHPEAVSQIPRSLDYLRTAQVLAAQLHASGLQHASLHLVHQEIARAHRQRHDRQRRVLARARTKPEPSMTKRFLTSCVCRNGFSTDVFGIAPMRAVPTSWMPIAGHAIVDCRTAGRSSRRPPRSSRRPTRPCL